MPWPLRFSLGRVTVPCLYRLARVMVLCDINDNFDKVFNPVNGDAKRKADGDAGDGVSKRPKGEGPGDREELRVYETMPAQMLNAYGMAGFAHMGHSKVWEDLNKPLKTGAKFMTEYCSKKTDRRCIAINRALQPLVEYLKYQQTDTMKLQNKFILKEEIFTQLYAEIEAVFESATYCLAGKKKYSKKGSSSLRTAVSFESQDKKEEGKLRAYAANLYNWVKQPKSRLRMLINWQMAGGLPFVCGTHLLGTQCFLELGNTYHDGEGDKAVALQNFQDCIVRRHEMEHEGHAYIQAEGNKENVADFE